MKVRVLFENIDNTWHFSSPDIAGWLGGGVTLTQARKLAVEGVEFCLESKDFVIEEVFDSSLSPLVE